MDKRLFLRAVGAAGTGVLLQGCGGGGGGGSSGGGNCSSVAQGTSSLLELLDADSRFSTLRSAVSKGGLEAALSDAAVRYTLFAPENDAFDALAGRLGLGSGTQLVATLTASQWGNILRYHVLTQPYARCTLGEFAANDTRPATLYSFEGDAQPIIFSNDNSQFAIWDGVGRTSITLPRADIAASNGVLHVSSDPILPRGVLTILQMLQANIDYFSDFAGPAAATGLLSGATKYTVFVPVNGLGAGGLSATQARRHIVATEIRSGGLTDGRVLTPQSGAALTVRVGGTGTRLTSGASSVTVTDVDFWASNGVIHVVNAVIP